MAAERQATEAKVLGDSLDAFVEGRLKLFSNQLAARNAEEEYGFSKAVLENNIALDEQLDYRMRQMDRVGDDPSERRRIRAELSGLKDRIEQKKFTDEYSAKLIDMNNAVSSVDSVISWLQNQKDSMKDISIQGKIADELQKQTGKRFDLQIQTIQNQTSYALRDKSASVIDSQISNLTKEKNKALLAKNDQLVSTYDLQLQALDQAKNTNAVESQLKNFAVATISGYKNSTSLLDSLNTEMSGAKDTGKVTVDGVTYNSPKEFWTYRRDAYLADTSQNGFFPRVTDEQKTKIKMKNSSGLLSDADVKNATSVFDSLSGRPELQSYAPLLNVYRQDISQTGADLRAKSITDKYSSDYDLNRAINSLDQTSDLLGVNLTSYKTSVINENAKVKGQQIQGITQRAGELVDKGVSPKDATGQAIKEGAGVVLSPEQLAAKSESQIASETVKAFEEKSATTDPRTTAGSQASKEVVAGAPPTTPQAQDLSQKYGIVGKTVYRKADGKAFTSEQEFFADSGLNSFQGVIFDKKYKPQPPKRDFEPLPISGTPKPPIQQVEHKVIAGDTLSAIAQQYLGDAKRYGDIAKANNIADPNKINVGQKLIIPKK